MRTSVGFNSSGNPAPSVFSTSKFIFLSMEPTGNLGVSWTKPYLCRAKNSKIHDQNKMRFENTYESCNVHNEAILSFSDPLECAVQTHN